MPEEQVYLEAEDVDLFTHSWFHIACLCIMYHLADSHEQLPSDEWYAYLRWIRGQLYFQARSERRAVLERCRQYQHQHEPFLSR